MQVLRKHRLRHGSHSDFVQSLSPIAIDSRGQKSWPDTQGVEGLRVAHTYLLCYCLSPRTVQPSAPRVSLIKYQRNIAAYTEFRKFMLSQCSVRQEGKWPRLLVVEDEIGALESRRLVVNDADHKASLTSNQISTAVDNPNRLRRVNRRLV